LRLAVMLPEGEDLNEWVAVNTVDFFNQVWKTLRTRNPTSSVFLVLFYFTIFRLNFGRRSYLAEWIWNKFPTFFCKKIFDLRPRLKGLFTSLKQFYRGLRNRKLFSFFSRCFLYRNHTTISMLCPHP
jgi:hypothetical protein